MPPRRASTRPDADDPRLRGRAYAVPFAVVWEAARELAGSTRGWTVREERPAAGEIRAEARTAVFRFVDDVCIRLSLDPTGLTRVDVESASRVGRGPLGTGTRRIARFLHDLDGLLERRPTT